ncbi:TetR/AcrR family transcriptional regulator [Brevibacillus borstelensis]|uniref:TetR/AcrR family transcriptional regulator n=2 Tax=Brevibacillus borstelensis TaxID=45462 RepID=UPI000F0856DB|nr:TetR/AcrR family transcriptional regulator [Brevibacillus borstelensis]MED1851901.1 TetR/AcrR family transcriptional regulator [Brevibacillus borstelensis]MED1875987.1 TetR/AcrR family transcriptional regulator [Brevibacillus borstelensis]MED1883845.1 TetR/AcrR family transcriptional regulator [Brevibacillus borstelensis]RNB62490.1 TetR/AcrR family transcriptional regulator [Brevibacillus borstelensis]GED54698.1 TetR family transcriptional regulator [Brevibacillus borstelensis]
MSSGNPHLSTGDKILLAAIDLMAEKGYKGVSTKEISAAAGLSEMTLFRHFGSKQKVLETAVDRFYYTVEMKRIFNEELVWDLQADLFLVSKTYHQIMNRNRKIVMIALKDGDYLPGFREKANKHPQQLKELLTDYFAAMQKRGLMITTDPEVQAMTFMWMNFGAFVSSLTSGQLITSTSIDEFIESSVQLFVRALTP